MGYLRETVVSVKAIEAQLYGKLVKPSSTRNKVPGILLVHGLTGDHSQKGRFDELAQELGRCGCCSLRIDCRGRGKSRGEFTVTNMIEDIAGSYHWLLKKR